MPDDATTIRLSEKDRDNIRRMIDTGVAANSSEAIRVALAIAPEYLKFWTYLLTRRVDVITERIAEIQRDVERRQKEARMVDLQGGLKHSLEASRQRAAGIVRDDTPIVRAIRGRERENFERLKGRSRRQPR